jgi:hypothetical protein
MDFLHLSTVGLAVWGVLSPFVGILFGHQLATRAQREQRLADNKNQEYREVLSALTTAYLITVKFSAAMVVFGPDEMRERDEAERRSLETLRNRLFIAEELAQHKVLDRWELALRAFDDKRDPAALKKAFEELESLVRSAARKSL